MISLERTLFTYFENVRQFIRAQPLNLGGIPGSGGGAGGPPGGFIGYLPQTRVAYDYSEVAASGPGLPPASGVKITLLDNLNHIRYRLQTLESGGGTGRIDLYKSGIVVASGITSLNLVGELNVTASGTQATIEHPIHNTEFYTATSGQTYFSTTYIYIPDSVRAFYNGLRQFNTDYLEGATCSGITFITPTLSGSKIVCDYLYYQSSQPVPSGGWGTLWGMPWGA